MTHAHGCTHLDHVPVEIVDRPTRGQESAPTITVVAHLCLNRDCGQQLPANWGCEDCEWEEQSQPRRLCDPAPVTVRVLSRPCPSHEGL